MSQAYFQHDSQSTPNFTTPINFTISSLEAAALSIGPRLLLSRIVLWSGRKGACWRSIATMAQALHVSERQVQRWKRDLIEKGFLAEYPNSGRAPFLVPYPRPAESRVSESSTGADDRGWGDKFGTQKEHEAKNQTLVGEPPPAVEFSPTVEPEQSTNVLESELQKSDRPASVDKPESVVIKPFSAPYPVIEPTESKIVAPQRFAPPVPAEKTTRTRHHPRVEGRTKTWLSRSSKSPTTIAAGVLSSGSPTMSVSRLFTGPYLQPGALWTAGLSIVLGPTSFES